jgi:hypothetical protein
MTTPPTVALPRFQVPQHGYSFHGQIMNRCLDLIDRGVWGGMKPVRLRRWFKNFDTEEERYFAACIMDLLIYRSDDQTTALLIHLFQRSLVDITRRDPPATGPITKWLEQLRSTNSSIRLVAAVQKHDLPHKSAHLVSRLMKRQLGIRSQWIAKPWELDQHVKNGAQTLVFIDDFLGTGRQFEELLRKEHLSHLLTSSYVIYAPFVAHDSGVDYLRSQFPNLKIAAAETLDDRHSVFQSESRCFDDGINTPELAKEFYLDLLLRKGISLRGIDRFGYGGLGLAYAFEHAVPDNNLPLLWWPSVGNWAPLFDR